MGSGGSAGFGNLVLEVPLPDSMDGGAKNTIERVLDFRLNDVIGLVHHPDKQPTTQSDEDATMHAAAFAKAMASFEAIDDFYATRHAKAVVFRRLLDQNTQYQ